MIVPRSRLLEILRGYVSANSDDQTQPDMGREKHLLALMVIVVSECEARLPLWQLECARRGGPVNTEWIPLADKHPRIGQRCIVCIGCAVQYDSLVFDSVDEGGPFWAHPEDDYSDDYTIPASDDNYWMPWPGAPV